jgi:hypothetical protein
MSKRLGLAVRLGLFAAGMTLAVGSLIADNVLPTVVVRGSRIHNNEPTFYGWLWDTSSGIWEWGWIPDEQGNSGGSDGLEPPTENPPDEPTYSCPAIEALQDLNQCGNGTHTWRDADQQCSGQQSFQTASFNQTCYNFDQCSNGNDAVAPWRQSVSYNDCMIDFEGQVMGACEAGYRDLLDILANNGIIIPPAPNYSSSFTQQCFHEAINNVLPVNASPTEFYDRRQNAICWGLEFAALAIHCD